MVECPDVVLAIVPVLALAGRVVASAGRRLESLAGLGGAVAQLPLTPLGLVAALEVIVVAMFTLPCGRRR